MNGDGLSRTWLLARKDLLLQVRDRKAMLIMLAMPLVFIAIIGFSVGEINGWQGESQGLKFAVVDESGDQLSRKVIAALEQRGGVHIEVVPNRDVAETLVQRQTSDVGLLIGRKFREYADQLHLGDVLDPRSGRLAAGIQAFDMQIVHKDSLVNVGGIAEQLVYAETIQTLAPHVAGKNQFTKQLLNDAQQSGPAIDAATVVEKLPVTGAKLTYQQLVPAYTVLFVFFLITIMARSFLSEREQGTLRRLRLTPLRPHQLLIGKTLPFFLLSIVQTTLLFLAGHWLFGMQLGDQPWLLIPTVFMTSLTATALGLMTATLVRTDSQVSAYAIFMLLTMGAISGCLMPRELLPITMQKASLITPHAWALIAFEEILQNTSPKILQILTCWAALGLFTVLFFSVGCQRFSTIDDAATA